MKLSDFDKDLLLEMGYLKTDLPYVEKAGDSIKCSFHDGSANNSIKKELSQKEAFKLLGRQSFLSGIARAVFHNTAMRETIFRDNTWVLFFC